MNVPVEELMRIIGQQQVEIIALRRVIAEREAEQTPLEPISDETVERIKAVNG